MLVEHSAQLTTDESFGFRCKRFAASSLLLLALIWIVWNAVHFGRWDNALAESLCFLAAAVFLAALWQAPRVTWARRFLRLLEAAAYLGASACIALLALFAPTPSAVVGVVLGLTHLAVLRAISVPSSGLKTALVTGSVLLPLAVAATVGWSRHGHEFVAFVIGPSAWWLVTSFLVAGISYMTFGLRREAQLAKRLGKYVLERKIGEGGMGAVYKARHALLKRPTALKLLSPEVVEQHSAERFDREVQLASQLSHPNTVTIYDYGVAADGTFYYAMEFLRGLSLGQVVERDGPQPPSRVISILGQVAGSLAEAHANALVHRDIKPSNILLCEHGGLKDVVKVVDFGLVKRLKERVDLQITGVNTLLGSPLYMPPESVLAPETYDERGDLYALGVVGYFLLTGETPFTGDNVVDVLSGHIHDEPVPPSARVDQSIPAELEALILDLLAKQPADRPQSAADVGARLASCEVLSTWTTEDARAWWSGHRLETDPYHHPGEVLELSRDHRAMRMERVTQRANVAG